MSMKLEAALADYNSYHHDPRNVATHAVGVPMILVAVMILLSRPSWTLLGLSITPATLAAIAATIFYLKLDLRFALAMAAILAVCHVLGAEVAARSTGFWLSTGVGLFVVGWIFQFVGHAIEGRKPAFFDDISSLLVGPLFMVAKLATALGLRDDVRAAIESGSARGARAAGALTDHSR